MKYFIYISIVIALGSCKPEPTYNPFDNVFDVNLKSITKEGCDTISGMCGYLNFKKRKNNELGVYYQTFLDDNQIYAKGFDYPIDTFKLNQDCSIEMRDSLINLPFDTLKFNNLIINYNYYLLKCDSENLWILNDSLNDTLTIGLNIYVDENNRFLRFLNYYIDKSQIINP